MTTEDECEVALRLSISAKVAAADAVAAAPAATIQIEIAAATPSVTWLRSDEQVVAVATAFREAVASIRAYLPRCSRIHLFAAVPAPVSIVIGQSVNPRMDPPVELYEYSRQRTPRYRHALTLQERMP